MAFSDDHIDAQLHEDVANLKIRKPTIVTNVSARPIQYGKDPVSYLPPFKSTMLQGTRIREADAIVTIAVRDLINVGGVILGSGWHLYADVDANFPKDIPLWISPHDSLGEVELDPRYLTRQKDEPSCFEHFQLTANLWFASANTDCVIHTGHPFIEVHTQVYGNGRMQKFTRNNPDSLYEDVHMPPGFTHEPFATFDENDKIVYPWHRYFADTDCIWIAFELKPVHA